jgi:cell division protein FtsA
MNNKLFGNHIAAIDIGTTKICVIIATTDSSGNLEIIGIGQHPSHGLKKGVVVNIGMTVDSIKKAVKQAEEMAAVKIESACVGISGGHIKSFNSTGVVAIKSREVKQTDIDRVIEAAKAIAIPKDQEIIHILPQYFKIDGQDFVLDSLGMYGVRLEAQVHIITGSVASAQNIIKSCELSGIQVSDIVLEQLASANAVLTPYEKELGAGILDIGGGTSDFAIYKDGRIRHSKVIPIAGTLFTSDIAIGLGIPTEKAEEIKKLYGSVSPEKLIIHEQNNITVDLGFQGGTKNIELSTAGEILRFRAEEVLDILLTEMLEYKVKTLMPAGLVLTGGGSLLDGLKELAQERLDMPVRIGSPENTGKYRLPDALKSPAYATAYGLMLYAIGQCGEKEFFSANKSAFGQVFKKMRTWIYDFF